MSSLESGSGESNGQESAQWTWMLPWFISGAILSLIILYYLLLGIAWVSALVAGGSGWEVPSATEIPHVLHRYGLIGVIGDGSAGWFYFVYLILTAALISAASFVTWRAAKGGTCSK